MFLKLDGIQGESQDDVHRDEIDVLAWSLGLSQSGSFHVGGGGGAGKAAVQDISFTKYIDKSSPELRLRVAQGNHINNAKLVVRKPGRKPCEYFVVDLDKVMVTSVSAGGSGGEDRLTENVTLNFAKIRWTYTEQDLNGVCSKSTTTGWDVETNQPWK